MGRKSRLKNNNLNLAANAGKSKVQANTPVVGKNLEPLWILGKVSHEASQWLEDYEKSVMFAHDLKIKVYMPNAHITDTPIISHPAVILDHLNALLLGTALDSYGAHATAKIAAAAAAQGAVDTQGVTKVTLDQETKDRAFKEIIGLLNYVNTIFSSFARNLIEANDIASKHMIVAGALHGQNRALDDNFDVEQEINWFLGNSAVAIGILLPLLQDKNFNFYMPKSIEANIQLLAVLVQQQMIKNRTNIFA